MRLAEFIVRVDHYERRTKGGFVTFFVTVLPLIFATALLAPRAERHFASIVGEVWAPILVVAPIATVVILSASVGLIGLRRLERRFGVGCPRCGTDLFASRRLVIATRNCPYCGARIIHRG